MLATMTPAKLLAACLVIAIASTVQGSVGFGLGLVASPILVLIDPAFVPGTTLFSILLAALWVARRDQQAMDVFGIKWGLVGRVFGTVIAAAVLAAIPQRELALTLGALVLTAVALSASGLSVRPTMWALVGAGVLSGFMSTVASTGGPPIALIYQKATGARIRSTLSGYFFIGSIISLVALVAIGRFGLAEFLTSLAVVPGILVGLALSKRTAPLLDRGFTRSAVLAVAGLSSAAVILRELL